MQVMVLVLQGNKAPGDPNNPKKPDGSSGPPAGGSGSPGGGGPPGGGGNGGPPGGGGHGPGNPGGAGGGGNPPPDRRPPIMGGVTTLNDYERAYWTAGKPKADWSGLDDHAPQFYTTPNQLRPMTGKAMASSYNYRKTGLDTKFHKKGDLAAFKKTCWTHFQDCGLDTIAYLPDPADRTVMINVVENHARVSKDYAKTEGARQAGRYDGFDHENDKAATAWLLDSLDETLRQAVDIKVKPGDTFPLVWMYLITNIQALSVDRFNNMKDRIRNAKPTDYAGQDLAQLATAFLKDAKELTAAGQYDHNLTLKMMDNFLLADMDEETKYNLRDSAE